MPKIFSEIEREKYRKELIEEYKKALKEESKENIISVEKLTKNVGIAKGTFYNFYNYKELLFVDVIKDVTNEIKSAIFFTLQQSRGKPKDKLKEILFLAFEFIEKYPWIYKISGFEYKKIISKLPKDIQQKFLEDDKKLYLDIMNSLNANFKVDIEDAIGIIQVLLFTIPYCKSFDFDYKRSFALLVDSLVDKVIE
jgi:hypothetical protein